MNMHAQRTFIAFLKPALNRIHLSHPASETDANGSAGWIVEKVTLTTTTLYWGATNEVRIAEA